MTEFFRYDELTWQAIDALPRDTPLVIPLGEGYSLERLASALSNPARIGLLPGIPFGWAGSGLPISEHLLEAFLLNLLGSLRDDGFSRVYALTPQGMSWSKEGTGLGASGMWLALPRQSAGESGSEQADAAVASCGRGLLPDSERGKVVIIPIGHTEQHAYHLPMSTDTVIIDAIAEGVAKAIPQKATRLPVMPYGVSMHRTAFAGTLNIGGRAFEDFWLGVIDLLAARGFDRVFLISGHGGNCSFLVNVVKYAGERHPRLFCATVTLYLTGTQGMEAIEKHRSSALGGMGHACELETSLMLHLRPDLVHMDRVADDTDFIATPSYYMDWVEGGALIANPPWYDDTISGAYGAGSLATAEKGRLWLEAAIQEKIAQVMEIHEQHERREARRISGYGRWGQNNKAAANDLS